MYARFGLNKNGAMAAWRCYGEFSSSNSQLACIDNNGERTNEACLDPIAENKIYCTRTKQIEAIIGPYWNYFDVLIEKKYTTLTLSVKPLCGQTALKSILWEIIFLHQLHDFLLLSLNLFTPIFEIQIYERKLLDTKKSFHFKRPIFINRHTIN